MDLMRLPKFGHNVLVEFRGLHLVVPESSSKLGLFIFNRVYMHVLNLKNIFYCKILELNFWESETQMLIPL